MASWLRNMVAYGVSWSLRALVRLAVANGNGQDYARMTVYEKSLTEDREVIGVRELLQVADSSGSAGRELLQSASSAAASGGGGSSAAAAAASDAGSAGNGSAAASLT
ncbi:hypothetical protein WJX74_009490 [Apatococcus lobatus]|uniref:Uncharacterized protein n=1 Tax=Apatococcus lobatus TaxID=904363 RepID=A0AAW1RSU8_9CHLO